MSWGQWLLEEAFCSPPNLPRNPPSSPPATAALGKRVQQITDAVLQNHIDPPARQQMILAGIKGLYQASGLPVPSGLSRRISTLTTPEQFSALLAELWPAKPAKPVPTQALEEALVEGLLDSVPGHATLMAAKELKVQEQIQGNRYVGIHIQLRYDDKDKRSVIQALVPGGPADRAGAKQEDRIEQVDGVDTQGMKIAQVVDRIRGPEGTEVVLVVRQPKAKEARTLKMVRGTLFLPTVTGLRKRSSGDWDFDAGGPDKIGYLRIQDITASTPHELRKLAAGARKRRVSRTDPRFTPCIASVVPSHGSPGGQPSRPRTDRPGEARRSRDDLRGDSRRIVPGLADRGAR